MATGIDFMAYARGRRTAEQENQQDTLFAQQQEEWLAGQGARDLKRNEQLWNQQAAAWLAPSLQNRQLAADAGISAVDYELQQREQTLANPDFQALPVEVQNLVLQKMQQRSLLTAQAAMQQGDVGAANRLTQAWGQQDAANNYQRALLSGDAAMILAEGNQLFGTNYQLAENGQNVIVNGVEVPINAAVTAWSASGGPQGLPAVAAQQESALAQAAQLQSQNDQTLLREWQQGLFQAQSAGPEAEARYLAAWPDPRGMAATGIPVAEPVAVPTPAQAVAAAAEDAAAEQRVLSETEQAAQQTAQQSAQTRPGLADLISALTVVAPTQSRTAVAPAVTAAAETVADTAGRVLSPEVLTSILSMGQAAAPVAPPGLSQLLEVLRAQQGAQPAATPQESALRDLQRAIERLSGGGSATAATFNPFAAQQLEIEGAVPVRGNLALPQQPNEIESAVQRLLASGNSAILPQQGASADEQLEQLMQQGLSEPVARVFLQILQQQQPAGVR